MLDQLIDKLNTDTVLDRTDDALQQARTRADEVFQQALGQIDRAKANAHAAANQGRSKLWDMETTALEQAQQVLDKAPENMNNLVSPIRQAVDNRFEFTLAVPVRDFDALNARNAIKEVRDLPIVDLQRLRRHEAEHKGRKTVLGAIDQRLHKLQDLPR